MLRSITKEIDFGSGRKLKLSTSRPVLIFIVRDFGIKLQARGSSA
ncbi:hypothetical protein F383_14838 [Gossypium arboreum]|uniref:Uncharacterized protein n=1 Tax=Gossypium arboreum TaxID=29729 RepID=A0A0B0N504_GOSAR|nr:hypothetical protein F383_14838 [Gossypium arboreum]